MYTQHGNLENEDCIFGSFQEPGFNKDESVNGIFVILVTFRGQQRTNIAHQQLLRTQWNDPIYSIKRLMHHCAAI